MCLNRLPWALALCGLVSCSSSVLDATPGTTFGKIFISSPAVDTRERLVNDRISQQKWLDQKLKESDSAVFDNNGSRQLRSSSVMSAQAALNFDPTGTALFHQNAGAIHNEQGYIEKLNDLDYQALLAKKKLILENAQKATDPNTINVSPPGATTARASPVPDKIVPQNLSDTTTSIKSLSDEMVTAVAPYTGAQPTSTPIEQFRDRWALRDEIRNEIIANSLDDRHDLRGNVLYRLSFDATVLPANDTGAYAVIGVCAQQEGGTRCGTNVSNTSESQQGHIANEKPAFEPKDEFLLRAAMRNYLIKRFDSINADFSLNATQADNLDDFTKLNIRSRELYRAGLADAIRIMRRLGGNNFLPYARDSNRLLAQVYQSNNSGHAKISTLISASGTLPKIKFEDLFCKLTEGTDDNIDLLPDTPRILQLSPAVLQAACIADEEQRIPMVRSIIAQLGLLLESESKLVSTNQTSEDEATFFKTYTQPGKLAALVYAPENIEVNLDLTRLMQNGLKRDKLEIYAYGATPKESVERISDIVTRREGIQLALGLQALVGNVGISALTDYMKSNEGLFNALRRQPLVVGFGHSNANFSNNEAVGIVDFGWVIGPRYGSSNDGKTAQFRQSVTQNALSAVISVPGWWDRVELVVRRYWIDEKGNVFNTESAAAIPPRKNHTYDQQEDLKYTIALPEDPGSIITLLDTRPEMYLDPASGWAVKNGNAAEILIRGEYLWRNPQVRLGGQFADAIHVLPDMRGVVAVFDKVDTSIGGGPGLIDCVPQPNSLPVTIATTNGYKCAGFASVKEEKAESTPLRASGPMVLIANGENTFTLNSALSGYFKIESNYRKLGTNNQFIHDSQGAARISENKIGYKPGKLKSIKSGDQVEMQLLVQLISGAEPERIPVDGKMVYYSSESEWSITTQVIGQRDDDTTATYSVALKFPKGYEAALGIKDKTAAFDTIGVAPSTITPCKINSSECAIEITIPKEIPINKVRLSPRGLSEDMINPFHTTLPGFKGTPTASAKRPAAGS